MTCLLRADEDISADLMVLQKAINSQVSMLDTFSTAFAGKKVY